MLHRSVYSFAFAAFCLLCGCQGYDVTVNEKVVYSPTPLFRDYTTPDPGLHNCIKQAINDGVVTNPQQLTALDCSFAGIESLDGLAIFSSLTELHLSANKIRNLVELEKLTSLQALYLDDNQIVDPVPLNHLPELRDLDLTGNPALQCPRSGSLTQVTKVKLPKHCR